MVPVVPVLVDQNSSKSTNVRCAAISRASTASSPAAVLSSRSASMRDISTLGGVGGVRPCARSSTWIGSTERPGPPDPGAKLGKDIFNAIMHGKPTEPQVRSLQDSLNALQSIKSGGEGKLQQLMTLKKSKSTIEQTMDAGEFRPQDRQAVLNDLNSLGPQGGGGLRRNRS